MIHFKGKGMSRVACLAVSAQASSDRPVAVDCPDCKTHPMVAGYCRLQALSTLAATLPAQNASWVVRVGFGDSEAATGFSACLPGIVR